jgi:hypothetical protein
LPAAVQTVLFDLHYNGLLSYSSQFWQDMIEAQWQKAQTELVKTAGSDTRKLDDANLLEQFVKSQ